MQVLITTLNAKYIHINLAVRLLYGLNRHRQGLDWCEFTIKESPDEVAAKCSHYQIVAFSCYIWNIRQTLEVCRRIKKLNPSCTIVLGGPEVSYDWQNVIAEECVDYIITGEGEIPFSAFLDHFPEVSHLPNIVSKKGHTFQYREQTQNFDLIGYSGFMPYAFDDPQELKNKVAYIETSRGCPYKCEFCLASLDNKVRYLPMETIKENLLYLMQHGKVIKFLDRTFNMKKDFTIEIFQFILEHHRPGNVFQFEITADILHPDIIKFMDEYVPKGLFRFEIGIQTVNQQANLAVSRKQNFEKTKSIIQQVRHKVELHLDLIVGLPLDYWADTKYSIEEVFKLFPPEFQLGFLKFLKGTPVREKYEQYGYLFDTNPPYQIIRSNFLSELELNRIAKLEHALEIYWNKKRAVNTLKYVSVQYSIFDFLLGLGEFFETKRNFHQYSLRDVFDIAEEFILKEYSNDKNLIQLLWLDYYLQFKVRPQPFGRLEIDKSLQNKIIEKHQLNHHKFRFLLFESSYVFKELRFGDKIKYSAIVFNGIDYPELIELDDQIPDQFTLKKSKKTIVG